MNILHFCNSEINYTDWRNIHRLRNTALCNPHSKSKSNVAQNTNMSKKKKIFFDLSAKKT